MARRVLIVYRVDEAQVSNQGVIKKLEGQAKGFTQNDCKVDVIKIAKGQILLNKNPIKQLSKSKFASVLFEFFQSVSSTIDFKDYDLLYIRYGLSFTGFISFLKKAKEDNPNIKILLEFPTYPYADEWTGTKGIVVKKTDGHYRKKLSQYVDYAIHLGTEKDILGMPCINSENGIDVENIVLRKQKNKSDQINLLAVGKWQFWHGLDRMIEGIAQAESPNRFVLNIVGKGPALDDLMQLVKEHELETNVIFSGELVGEQLNEQFDLANIGIGTLGMHRKNISIDSSLKHREYVSRGLPFILCTPDLDFQNGLNFIQYFPQSDEPIDMKQLISFARKVKGILPQELRSFASDQLSWKSKISRILRKVDE